MTIQAALAVAIPLAAGGLGLGNLPATLGRNFAAMGFFAVLVVLWEGVVFEIIYEKVILAKAGLKGRP